MHLLIRLDRLCTTFMVIQAASFINPVISQSEDSFEEGNSLGDVIETFEAGADYLANMDIGVKLGLFDSSSETSVKEKPENPDIKLNVTQLIKKYGYPVESHNVFTEDDYVLTLHRIPYGRHQGENDQLNETLPEGKKRPVVFFHHGLCSSSVDWIQQPADKALPYILANAGYDVWLGNARGNKFSRRHITMTPKRSKYWDFSWHEIGIYDIPCVIDYILKLTSQDKLDYIGHSMGTTAFFVAMSMKPEYNDKVRKMIALAPAVHMEDMKANVRYLAAFTTVEKFLYDLIGNGEILPEFLLSYLHKSAPGMCAEPGSISSKICDNIYYAVGGYNPEQMNETQLPVILAHTPSSCSTKCGVHYLQVVSSEKFRQYDYGLIGNLKRYDQMLPPKYPIKKVTVPITIFWSENDILVDPKGVQKLVAELPNLESSNRINDSKFTHIDFLFAKDADKLLYRHVLAKLLA